MKPIRHQRDKELPELWCMHGGMNQVDKPRGAMLTISLVASKRVLSSRQTDPRANGTLFETS